MVAPAALLACPLVAGVVAGIALHAGPVETRIAIAVGWALAALAFQRRLARAFAIAAPAAALAIGAAIGGHAVRAADTPSLLAWYRETPAGARSHDEPVKVVGTLREDAAQSTNSVTLTLDAGVVDGRNVQGAVRVSIAGMLAADAITAWRAGRTVSMTAQLREPIDFGDPGVGSDRERLARQGIVLVGSVKSAALVTASAKGSIASEGAAALRAWVRTATEASVGGWSRRSAGVVTAILIGDRTGLSADDERRLQEAGTYHVIAISGGNIALLTALLVALGRMARFPPRGTAAGSIALLAFYGYAAGLAPSVLRATVAGMIYLAARALDHRGAALNALAVAAGVAAVAAPLTIADPGFILSFGATTGIIAAAARLMPMPARNRRGSRTRLMWWTVLSAARALIAATICAEIALAPVGARLFGRVSFAGLLLNFAAIPLMAVIQIAGLAAVALAAISTSIASVAGWVAHAGTVALLWSASLVDAAPWLVRDIPPPAAWLIVVWYGGWTGVLFSGRRVVRAVGSMTVLFAAILLLRSPIAARAHALPPPSGGWTRVVVFDVGQGDATLVWPAGAEPLLIDAGGTPGSSFDIGRRVTLPAAWAFGLSRLGALVLTHGDPDHIGGAPAILRALAPREAWEGIHVPRHQPMRLLHDAAVRAGVGWIERRAGQRLAWGSATIGVLNPPDPDWERQKVRNDDSIVLDIRVGGVAVVLPGDITRAVEPAVAAAFDRAPFVILKVPHHGSAGSSSPALIAALHPSIAIVSAGKRNPFGHPAPAVLDRYRAAGAQVFSTAEDGAVVVDTDGRVVHVWTWGSRRELLLHRE